MMLNKKSVTAIAALTVSFVAAIGAQATAQDQAAVNAYRVCAACHLAVPADDPKAKIRMMGPNLFGVYGAAAGQVEGFAYSKALKESNVTWDEASLGAFIESPFKFIPGNRMGYGGEKNAEKRALIIEFLKARTEPPASE